MFGDLIQFSWYAAPYFPAAVLVVGTGLWIVARERGNRISRDFLAFTVLFAAWMLTVGARLLLADAEAATLAARCGRAALSLGVPPLLQFSFAVLQSWREHRLLMRINCLVGTALALISVGSPWIVAGVSQASWGFKPQNGLLSSVFTLWAAGMMGWLVVDAVRGWRRSRHNGFQRRQIRMFSAALAVLLVGAASLLSYRGGAAHVLGTACIVAFALTTGYIAVRHGIANVTARFASTQVADVLRAGMLILDQDGIVQFTNEPAARMLGVSRHALIDQALHDLLGEPTTPHHLSTLALARADGGGEVAYQPPHGAELRHFALSVSAMNDPRGEPTAFVCLMRDVTEEHRERARRAAALLPRQPTREELELRQALEQREFVVHYQPVVELRRGTVAGFEALVRWMHPRLGLLRPDAFLPAAEALGLLAAIDRLVLEQACADLPRMRAESGQPWLFVSVNQSTAALSNPELTREASEIVARCGLSPKDLRLELLESTVVIDAVRETLCSLRDAGFGICIDDFGTGHSALSRLHEAPVTTLKIDRLFVREMLGGNGRKIIGSIVALASSVDLGVIAEGVSTPTQVELLREMGCGYAQGYLYSPALGLEEAIALLRRRNEQRDRRSQVLDARVAGTGLQPST